MAKIATTGRNKYKAIFNRRTILITQENKEIKVIDTNTGEIIEGAEHRSVRNLLEWHVKSKRDASEVATLWTVNP